MMPTRISPHVAIMTDPGLFNAYKPVVLVTNSIPVLRLFGGYETDPTACELVEIFLEDDGVP